MSKSQIFQVVGERTRFDFNKQSGKILLKENSGAEVWYIKDDEWTELETGREIDAPLPYEGLMAVSSKEAGLFSILLQHLSDEDEVLEELQSELLTPNVSLDIDANRDGVVGENEDGKANWVWGKGQRGAIILVNNDRDTSDLIPSSKETSELSELIVRPTKLSSTLPELELTLYATPSAAERFSIYRQKTKTEWVRILGKNPKDETTLAINVSPPLNPDGERLLIEAHEYPGPFFEGLLTIELHARYQGQLFATDRAVFRVAPWIMTPNTLPVEQVYVCDMSELEPPNPEFLEGLKQACADLKVPLMVLPTDDHKGDRWIQDEIEFGYSESPKHILPVVCDSPRDRELDDFPEKRLLGPDFGHFQVGGSSTNSLDSFGNLEVSPPVTVRGREYPFGRIIFGGRAYGDYRADARKMMPELRQFLYAQKVQSPIEIYTDWLGVGHTDEIISFVPANNAKGFQILFTSPRKAHAILKRLQEDGHGAEVMFKGRKQDEGDDSVSAEITVDELLAKEAFWKSNDYFQKQMDLNREILKTELEIGEVDIIEIPVLFTPINLDDESELIQRTGAFYPDMVNHLVIGSTSIVPKPYGPVVEGECVFERAFRTSLPDRNVRFIDDWYSYHKMQGEVHCGTNARRKPFSDRRWWESKPDGSYDI